MATKQIRIDDLDGKTEGADTVFFSLQDVFYRLDLAPANLKKLVDFLQPFIDKAEPCEAPKGGKRTPASDDGLNGYGSYDPAVVRAWASANGVAVSDKGRVSEDVVNKWRAATAPAPKG